MKFNILNLILFYKKILYFKLISIFLDYYVFLFFSK